LRLVPQELTLRAQPRGALTVYPAANLADLGVDAFVTDRFNGVSTGPYDSLNLGDHVGDDDELVRVNRSLVARAAGVESSQLIMVRQVHGTHVMRAENANAGAEADALLCDDASLALAILVADCVPLALFDERSKRVAVVHAGWRGLAAGVIYAALRDLQPATTHAFIGPSISKEGYQVGPEVADRFGDVPGAVAPDGPDRSRLDLRAVAVHQLRRAGVPDGNIALSREVTDGGEIFFSDRAQRPCGRFAVVAKRAVA
jgi:hypothetical protein